MQTCEREDDIAYDTAAAHCSLQHYRKQRRIKSVEERDKKKKRAQGLMPEKPKVPIVSRPAIHHHHR